MASNAVKDSSDSDDVSTKMSSEKKKHRSKVSEPNPWDYVVERTDKGYHCITCDCNFPNHECADDHATGKVHAAAVKKFVRRKEPIIVAKGRNDYFCGLCYVNINDSKKVYEHLKTRRHSRHFNEIDTDSEDQMSSDPEIVPKVKNRKVLEKSPGRGENPWHYLVKKGPKGYHCIACGCNFSSYPAAREHANGTYHENTIYKYLTREVSIIIVEGRNSYYCAACQESIGGSGKVYRHLKVYKHRLVVSMMDSDDETLKGVDYDIPHGSPLETSDYGPLSSDSFSETSDQSDSDDETHSEPNFPFLLSLFSNPKPRRNKRVSRKSVKKTSSVNRVNAPLPALPTANPSTSSTATLNVPKSSAAPRTSRNSLSNKAPKLATKRKNDVPKPKTEGTTKRENSDAGDQKQKKQRSKPANRK